MKRVKICVCILTMLLTLGIVSGVLTGRQCSRMTGLIDRTAAYLTEGDNRSAAETAASLEHSWGRFRRRMRLLMNNSRLSELDRICSRLEHLIKSSSGDAEAELAELRHMTEQLKRSEIPYLTSIF